MPKRNFLAVPVSSLTKRGRKESICDTLSLAPAEAPPPHSFGSLPPLHSMLALRLWRMLSLTLVILSWPGKDSRPLDPLLTRACGRLHYQASVQLAMVGAQVLYWFSSSKMCYGETIRLHRMEMGPRTFLFPKHQLQIHSRCKLYVVCQVRSCSLKLTFRLVSVSSLSASHCR